ncbi:uncharacterized protein FOMMEDRAFT_46963, partial [Fomitiporia mediterranea MF3/22]|uniref:uncharacterized protein n=1 Tax=Fomitiporia mediterranea (strain MF3/22) TaxID=694068 RepID=UPI0004407DB3
NPPVTSKNPRYIPPEGDKCPIEELLPPEVLAYIFEIGTRAEEADESWDVEEDDGDEDYEDLPFPVRMSHVCRRWRRIAINMPSLWTTLDFAEPRPFEKSRVWLERSKQAPLNLVIDLSVFDDESDSDTDFQDDGEDRELVKDRQLSLDLNYILDLIIPHVSRWRTFELSVTLYKHIYLALKRLEKCPADPGAPLLETFALFCHEDSDDFDADSFVFEEYREHILPFGGNAPKLIEAGLWGVHIDWKLLIPLSERSALSSLYSTPTATTNLTDLEFAYHSRDVRPPYEEFITILRCAPNLTSLKLSGSGPAPRQHGPAAQSLFLPNLRYLQLGFLEEDYACALLRLFYAPALKGICLDFDEGIYNAFIRQLAAPMPLPDPQPPNFRDSKLSGIPCSAEIPQHFYSASPLLKRLYLNMNYLPPEFFSVLTAVPTRTDSTTTQPVTPLCKYLESLTISGISGNELVAFVKKRKSLGVPIRELNIDETDIVTDEEESWLIANVGSVEFVEISDDELVDLEVEDADEGEGEGGEAGQGQGQGVGESMDE